jgi:hypothetical protein
LSTELATRPEFDRPPVGDDTPDRRGGRWTGWVARNRVDIALLLALMVTVGVIHAIGMNSFPARFDDEGAYMSQAWAVLKRFDLSHYTYWYDHPPVGWIILAIYTGLTGGLMRAPYGVAAGREAMLIFNLVSVALLYVLARRIGLRRPFAALVVLLFGLSPLGIFYHRMVLLDNLAMPLLLAGLVLVLSPGRRLGAHVSAAASLAIALLIREILVLFIPFAIWLYWRNTKPENRRYSVALTATTFFGLLLLYPIFALLRGELLPSGEARVSLMEAIMWQLFGRQGSGSVFDSSSPAGEVAASWLDLDPWILMIGLAMALILLFIPRFRWVGVVVVVQGLMLLRTGYLPVMFIVPVLPFLALAIGAVFDESWRVAASASRPNLRSSFGIWVRRGLVTASVAALVFAVFPKYQAGVARAMESEADQPFVQAQEWLETNLEPEDVLLVDGALWLDVVEFGHPVENTIWFYKLDSDPGVDLSEGWESVDYIISSEVVRNSLYDLPQMETALDHSEQVTVFGQGEGRIEIRRVEP